MTETTEYVEFPVWEFTPKQAMVQFEVTEETLRARALALYLGTKSTRTEAKFNALWSRWSRDKSNMPLCVQSALEAPALAEQARSILHIVRPDLETPHG